MGQGTALRLGICLLIIFTLPAATSLGAEAGGKKLAEPSTLDRKEAERAIRKTYQEEFARKTPEAMRTLAAKLLGKAKDSRGSPAQCYALLIEARDLAVAVPDARLALDAVEETASVFQVDRMELRKSVLSEAARSVRTPDAAKSVADGFLSLLADAAAGEDYDWVKKVLGLAPSLSGTAGAAGLPAAIAERGPALAEAQKRLPAARS